MKGPPQYRSQSRRVDFPFGLRRGQRAIRGTCRSPLAEESRTYAESPAFNPLRASASKTAETRYARIAGASGRRFPTSQTPAAERLQASAEAARVLSSDRRNRSQPAARGGPIPASHTAASRLIQQSTEASEAAALVLAIQEFVANGGGRPWSAPPQVLHRRGGRAAVAVSVGE